MYSPTLGRFITKDPIGFQAGDVNLYRFVANNPANATDPSGLKPEKPEVETKPDPDYMYKDQLIFGDSLNPDAGKVEARVVSLFQSLYRHPAVKKWVINYSDNTDFLWTDLRRNASERSVFIYLGHGAPPNPRLEKFLKPVFDKYAGDVVNGVPTGPLVIQNACFCYDWHKLLPQQMRITNDPYINTEGKIKTDQMVQYLALSLAQTIKIVDQWLKQDPCVSVTVRVTINYADGEGRLNKMSPELKKEFANRYMADWIAK